MNKPMASDEWWANYFAALKLQLNPTMEGKSHPTFGKYKVVFFGKEVFGDTLAQLEANFVDVACEFFPDSVAFFSKAGGWKKAYISREKIIRPSQASVNRPTLKCRSGWFVFQNNSRSDVVEFFVSFCGVNGLTYGRDIVFFGSIHPLSGAQ